MRKFLAIAALCLASSFHLATPVLAAGSGSRNDVDNVVFWGANDGVQCQGSCIKWERRGSALMTFVHGRSGELMHASIHDMANDVGKHRFVDDIVLKALGLPDGVIEDDAPRPPVGGTGVVVVNTTATGSNGVWVTTVSYHFVNGNLVNVTSSTAYYNNNPE